CSGASAARVLFGWWRLVLMLSCRVGVFVLLWLGVFLGFLGVWGGGVFGGGGFSVRGWVFSFFGGGFGVWRPGGLVFGGGVVTPVFFGGVSR
ncbi:hypothetical protein, partial [Stenotrophomonas maltophilia]|uniref:hypothetical protein n=1 Tax=Stenotrophomonas maltophilia TaxID=40324 RepID=UPI003144FFD0